MSLLGIFRKRKANPRGNQETFSTEKDRLDDLCSEIILRDKKGNVKINWDRYKSYSGNVPDIIKPAEWRYLNLMIAGTGAVSDRFVYELVLRGDTNFLFSYLPKSSQ